MKKSKKRISKLITIALLSTFVLGNSIVNADSLKVNDIDSGVEASSLDSSDLASYYGTNPNGQVGVNKTIKSFDDWTADTLIAQGAANDDPRVYRGHPDGGSVHEKPVDDYAMYAAWDDDNIYIAWIMTNVTDVVAPDQDYPQSDNGKPTNGDLCQVLAFNVDPLRGGPGNTTGTTDKGIPFKGSHPWDLRVEWETKVDRIACLHSNNTQKQNIFFLNEDDEFDYDTAVDFNNAKGATTGTRLTWKDGFIGTSLWGINGYASGPDSTTRVVGDMTNEGAEWVDFLTLGHDPAQDTIYQITIPYEDLGTSKEYLEANGIGVMHMTTFGQSGMDSLPYDLSMNDNAADAYSADASSSMEKEDTDVITAPLASIGKLRAGSTSSNKLKAGKLDVDVAAPQEPGTKITFTAEAAGGTAPYTYEFFVDGKSVQAASSSETFEWTPEDEGEHTIKVQIKDAEGTKAERTRKYQIGEGTLVPPEEPDDKEDPDDKEEPENPEIPENPDDKEDPDDKEEPGEEIKATIKSMDFDKKSPQFVGETINVTAKAEGAEGETFKYKFSVEGKDGEEDLTAGYVTSNKASWEPIEAGTYKVKVSVKGSKSEVVEKTVTYKITEKEEEKPGDKEEPLDISMATSIKSPQEVGKKIKLTATATGGLGDKEYKFLVDGKEISKGFISNNSIDWTPTKEGTYLLSVVVKDDNDEIESVETKFIINAKKDDDKDDPSIGEGDLPTADASNILLNLAALAGGASIALKLRKKK